MLVVLQCYRDAPHALRVGALCICCRTNGNIYIKPNRTNGNSHGWRKGLAVAVAEHLVEILHQWGRCSVSRRCLLQTVAQYGSDVVLMEWHPCLVEPLVDGYVASHFVDAAFVDAHFAERHGDAYAFVKIMDGQYALLGSSGAKHAAAKRGDALHYLTVQLARGGS